MSYRVEYLRRVADEDMRDSALRRAGRSRPRSSGLTGHPIEHGTPLRYSLKDARRLRVGDWRVLYTIEAPDVVLVVKIGHRRDVYEK